MIFITCGRLQKLAITFNREEQSHQQSNHSTLVLPFQASTTKLPRTGVPSRQALFLANAKFELGQISHT